MRTVPWNRTERGVEPGSYQTKAPTTVRADGTATDVITMNDARLARLEDARKR